MSNQEHESDDTLDLVRSMRDTLRDVTSRAEVQNALIKDSFNGGFMNAIPGEPADLGADSNEPPPADGEEDLRDH